MPEKTKQLLDTISEMALKNGAKLLFINLPYSHLNDDDMSMYQAIETYMHDSCNANGVDFKYVDYNQRLEEIGFDCSTDFRDYSHLNNSGAEKVSIALAGYINRKYDLRNKGGQE